MWRRLHIFATIMFSRLDCTAVDRVPTRKGTLQVHRWEPERSEGPPPLTVVTVHPWATLGGSEWNCVGVAQELAKAGLRGLTFNMNASSLVWGVVTNHSSEVKQIVDVCEWASKTFGGKVLLFGSSAGAPQAGSALDLCDSVVGYASVGYTFGWFAAIGFGRHFNSLIESSKPRLLILGDKDEFTSVATFEKYVAKANQRGRPCQRVIFPGCGHFELESPSFDGPVSECVLRWVDQMKLREA